MWDGNAAWVYLFYSVFLIIFGKASYLCLRYFDRRVGPYITALLYMGASMLLVGGMLQVNVSVAAVHNNASVQETSVESQASIALPPQPTLVRSHQTAQSIDVAKYTKPGSDHPAHEIPEQKFQCQVTLDLDKRSLPWEAARFSKYDRYFKKYTKKYFGSDADWRWFKVQAYVESSFNARATSRAGAVGVMQILPDTYKEIVQRNRFFRGKSVYEAEWNIAAGIYYNRSLLRQWNKIASPEKSLQLMFASYNAGFGRIRRAVSDDELSINHILVSFEGFPAETVGYLLKMTRLMEEYRGIAFAHNEASCTKPQGFAPLLLVASN